MTADTYRTILEPSYGEYKSKGSQFLAYAYPILTAEEVKKFLVFLKKEHFKAVHHCYAYRLGVDNLYFRVNDDGEPSGSAGKPILGQIDSFTLTDIAIIVVRYFGGTLLGVPGLIQAYKLAAKEALNSAKIVEKVIPVKVEIQCGYSLLSEVLRILNLLNAKIVAQDLQLECTIQADIPKSEYAHCQQLLKHYWEVKIKILKD